MSIIGGLDVHRAQITFDWVDRDSGETTGVGSRQRPGWGCAAGWGSCPGSRAGSRWRAAPAGGLWSRSSRRPGWPLTWPSRPRPAACAAPSGGPRPTVPTPGCCASCSSRAGCPAPGSRRPGSWICGPPCGCARPWSTSGPPGSSASTPRCSITAAPPCPGAAVAGQPRLAGGVALPPASRQLLGSRWARSTGWMPSRPRSTSGCVPGPPVRRRRPGGAGHRAGHHRVHL